MITKKLQGIRVIKSRTPMGFKFLLHSVSAYKLNWSPFTSDFWGTYHYVCYSSCCVRKYSACTTILRCTLVRACVIGPAQQLGSENISNICLNLVYFNWRCLYSNRSLHLITKTWFADDLGSRKSWSRNDQCMSNL